VIVCLCKGVSDRDIRAAVRQGSASVREVGERCRAGTDCGLCRVDIRELIQKERGGYGSPTVAIAK
jgi:bacterioferritin-associated ferredoxin